MINQMMIIFKFVVFGLVLQQLLLFITLSYFFITLSYSFIKLSLVALQLA
jgi:hypothetical protein